MFHEVFTDNLLKYCIGIKKNHIFEIYTFFFVKYNQYKKVHINGVAFKFQYI